MKRVSRSYRALFILIGILAILYPAVVVAEEAMASTGTLVAAALETSGYRAQSLVLRDLDKALNGLGVLLYVGCAISAIITIALGGKYSAGLWFIIGPAIFHFLVKTTTLGAGVEWQFGSTSNGTEAIENLTQGEAMSSSEVSWFFHRYNVLVSNIIQQLIALITNRSIEDEMKFTVRQRMMDDMMNVAIGSPGLLALVRYGLADCSRELDAARQLALGERDPAYKKTAEYRKASDIYDKSWKTKGKGIEAGPASQFVATLLKEINTDTFKKPLGATVSSPFGIYEKAVNSSFGDDVAAIQNGTYTVYNKGLNCDQIWTLMGLGVYWEALQYIERSTKNLLPEASDDLIFKLQSDIATKMTSPPNYYFYKQQEAFSPNPEDMYREIPTVQSDPSIIPLIVGGYMLRKSMTDTVDNRSVSQFAKHAGVQPLVTNFDPNGSRLYSDEELMQFDNYQSNHLVATDKKYSMFAYAMALPYLQGILLYTLGLTFPFFALMVILLGKANALFGWLSLWAWVKSWDVGWAIVMMLDGLLWELMPHSSVYDPAKDPNHGPVSVMESAFQGDTSYSLSGYYSLVALLLSSVPIVTAKLVLRGKAAAATELLSLFKGIGSTLGKLAQTGEKQQMGQRMGLLRDNWIRQKSAQLLNVFNGKEPLNNLPVMFQPFVQSTFSQMQGTEKALAKEFESSRNWRNSFAGIAVGAHAADKLVGQALSNSPNGALRLVGHALHAGKWAAGMAAAKYQLESRAAGSDAMKRHIDLITQSNDMVLYEATKSTPVMQLQTIYAGATSRGEHQIVPDAPLGMLQGVTYSNLTNQARIDARQTRYNVEAAVAGLGAMLFREPVGGDE